jgi:hypothetical protein
MTDQEPRFCPRCGTALVAGLPFCPSCGRNSTEAGDRSAQPAGAQSDAPPPDDAFATRLDAGLPAGTLPAPHPTTDGRPLRSVASTALRRLNDPASRGSTIVVGALIVAAGLVLFGLLMRPSQPNAGTPGAPDGSGGVIGPDGTPAGPSAPIVGLTIQSPADGQAVATKEVTVIGIAPPGLTITRDVSFNLDQHATADGSVHWAINVGLDEGENNLVFRIGDDRSTEQRLRVIYTPQKAP